MSKPKKAIRELKTLYPKLPKTGIARNDHSTYLHLIICYLEYKAIRLYLGPVYARKILNGFIKHDNIYPWVYQQVLKRPSQLEVILRKYGLLPEILMPVDI